MPPHKSKSNSISFVEGQQNGAGDASPLRLLLRGRLRRFVLPVYLLSLRGFDSSRSAFYLSRQRHGAGMNQKRLHRHATAAVCGSCASTKKPCRTKPPAPAFSLPHTTLRVRFGRCAFCLLSPARPSSLSGYGGRTALLVPASPATLPIRPKVAPCAICEAAMVECLRTKVRLSCTTRTEN